MFNLKLAKYFLVLIFMFGFSIIGSPKALAQCLWPEADNINNGPSVKLLPDGHSAEVSYTYTYYVDSGPDEGNFLPDPLKIISVNAAAVYPNIELLRSNQLGFINDRGTQTGSQFNNYGTSFDKNPPYNSSGAVLYYQAEIDNGSAKVHSTTTAVNIPSGINPRGRSCTAEARPGFKSARQVSSNETSLTFELTYTVGPPSYATCGCSLSGCFPIDTPPYLEIQQSSVSTPAFVSWNTGTGQCTRVARQCGSTSCYESTYTANYTIGLPPETSDTFSVTGYAANACKYTAYTGTVSFSGGTIPGSAPAPFETALSAIQSQTTNREPFIQLSWNQTSEGQLAKVYREENTRWSGNDLGTEKEVVTFATVTSSIIDDLANVPAGTYYYGADLYQDGWCGHVYSNQTPFAWGGYTPPPCILTSASWSQSQATEGDQVTLTVVGSNCSGKTVSFDVRENDSLLEGLLDEPALVQPQPVIFNAIGTAQATWIAEWQNDCAGLCNPPEYFFNATVDGMTTIRSKDPLLSVNQKPPIPSPTPEPTPQPTAEPISTPSPVPSPTDNCIDCMGNKLPPFRPEGVGIGNIFGFGNILTLGEGTFKLVPTVFSIAAFLVILYFLLGAFKYLMAGASKEDVEAAKQMIYHAIIGFFLLMLAFIILQYIIPALFGLNNFRIIH